MARKNSSEYWEDRIASNTWKTYNSLEEKNRELLNFYIDASKAVKDELYTLAEKCSRDGVLTLSEMHKQNRLTELNKKYEQIALELGKQTEKASTKNMQEGFRDVYKHTAVGLGESDFSMPNKKLMEKLLNEPWRGDSFSGRLWKNQKKLAVGLNDLLLTGLQQGKTVTEIAVQLHNFMGQGFNSCHRLVRTETMHYLNSATLQRYKDSGIEYVQVWAAQDERTCEVCGSYHGKVYPINKCPILPFHANCRCTIIPCFDEKLIQEYVDKQGKDGIIKAGAVSGARNPFGEAASKHAETYYGLIRSMTTDVSKIARNTSYTEDEIRTIKNYLFVDEHDLGDSGVKRFDPDYMIAESWQRLMENKAEPHDLVLIKHEIMERELMGQGMTQDEAHRLTSQTYDYGEEAKKFYAKIKKYKKE